MYSFFEMSDSYYPVEKKREQHSEHAWCGEVQINKQFAIVTVIEKFE